MWPTTRIHTQIASLVCAEPSTYTTTSLWWPYITISRLYVHNIELSHIIKSRPGAHSLKIFPASVCVYVQHLQLGEKRRESLHNTLWLLLKLIYLVGKGRRLKYYFEFFFRSFGFAISFAFLGATLFLTAAAARERLTAPQAFVFVFIWAADRMTFERTRE